MTEKTMGDRVKERRTELGLSQKEIARLSGLSQPTISALERNEAILTRKVGSLAFALQSNALWLESGAGDANTGMRGHASGLSPDGEDDALYEIPVVDSRGSCGIGDGTKPDVEDLAAAIQPIIKDKAFFNRLGVEPNEVVAVIADGDSMANFIVHGDTVLICTTQSDRLLNGSIYAFQTQHGIRIKRFLKRDNGVVALSSDNPDKGRYPDDLYTAEQAKTLGIVGRYLYREG